MTFPEMAVALGRPDHPLLALRPAGVRPVSASRRDAVERCGMTTKLPIEPFLHWLAFGERGVSSETIVAHLTGRTDVRKYGWMSEPIDPGDFRRCERMLRQVPAARLAFPAMRSVSPEWAALVDAWDELAALMEEEAPGVFDDAPQGRSTPRAYKRLRELLGRAA